MSSSFVHSVNDDEHASQPKKLREQASDVVGVLIVYIKPNESIQTLNLLGVLLLRLLLLTKM